MSQRKRSQVTRSQQANENPETYQANRASIEDLSKKFVRFLLTKMRSNLPIKRADIIQYVFQERPGKTFDLVLGAAAKELKIIYGLNLEIVDSDSSAKKYFISNKLPYAHLIPCNKETDLKSTITFLILAHIFMSKNNSTDLSLWKFLKEFDITPKTECETLGNIKVFIMQTLVKQGYVVIEDRGGEHDDGEPKKRFRWGSRADEVVCKMDILRFVSQLYDDQDIKFWSDQFKNAKEQFAGVDPSL